ncbi:MAG TPA: VOC family protein [Myxococcales bacterium]|jgi:catechol 2,3-dioxygenase-like lactoylglutathione lyase family enzyme|nr:VOC family protein [Myxococcales bacterium]
MYDHVSLKVRNFTRSLAFYTAALAPLGYEPQGVDEASKSAGFGPPGAVGLYIAQATPASQVHLAFVAPKRGAVDQFYSNALEHSGKDNGKPGLRADYGKNYYAAFVFDPDGNNLEAVTHSAK